MLERILDFRWAHDVPVSTARLLFFAFFAAVTALGVLRSSDDVYRGAEDRARWRDLRLWVIAVMAIPFGLYLVL